MIMRVSGAEGQASVIWATCMACTSRKTTNNIAEFRGLCAGLADAHLHHRFGTHVVGDSPLTLNFLKHNRSPRSQSLLLLYLNAQMLAGKLAVGSWMHHYRCENEMADSSLTPPWTRHSRPRITGRRTTCNYKGHRTGWSTVSAHGSRGRPRLDGRRSEGTADPRVRSSSSCDFARLGESCMRSCGAG